MNISAVDTSRPDTHASASHFADFARPSLDNGYSVIPLVPHEKRPWPNPEWRDACWTRMTPDAVGEHARMSAGSGVGLACGRYTVAFDLDVDDADVVNRLRDMVERVCGPTPLVRVGRPPRLALVYRSAEPIVSIRIPRVDILGLGAQLAAYGRHPVTGREFQWHGSAAPHCTPIDSLPAVTNIETAAVAAEIFRAVYGDRFERMVFDLDFDLIRLSFSSRSQLMRQWMTTLFRGKKHAREMIVRNVELNEVRPGYWGYVMRPQIRGGFDHAYFQARLVRGDFPT